MENEQQQMIEKMTAVRADIVALVNGLDETTRNFRPADGRWTVRENLAHLVDAEKAHRRFVQALLTGKVITARPRFDRDRWNEDHVAKRAAENTDSLLAAMAEQRAETLAVINDISAEKWLLEGNHPALGPVTVRQVVKIIGVHEKMHLRDIQAVLTERAG